MARPIRVLNFMAIGIGAAAVCAFAAVAFNGFGAAILADTIHLPMSMGEILQSSAIGGGFFVFLGVPVLLGVTRGGDDIKENQAGVTFAAYLLAIASAALGGLARGLIHGQAIGYMAASAAIGTALLPVIIMAGAAILFGIFALCRGTHADVKLPPITQTAQAPSLVLKQSPLLLNAAPKHQPEHSVKVDNNTVIQPLSIRQA